MSWIFVSHLMERDMRGEKRRRDTVVEGRWGYLAAERKSSGVKKTQNTGAQKRKLTSKEAYESTFTLLLLAMSSSSPFSSLCTSHTEGLSLFSLGCFRIWFCQCCLCFCSCPPLPSLVFFQLPAFSSSLSFSFIPSQALALCLLNKRESLCWLCFFQTWCFRQTSGVPEHVLTTPTHRTSCSTFKQQKHTHTHGNTWRQADTNTWTHLLCFRKVNIFSNTSSFPFCPVSRMDQDQKDILYRHSWHRH